MNELEHAIYQSGCCDEPRDVEEEEARAEQEADDYKGWLKDNN